MTHVMLGPLTIYNPLTFSCFVFSEPIRSPFFEPFPPLESEQRARQVVHLVAFFFYANFFTHFLTPLVASVCAPHRPPSECSTLFTWAIHSCHTTNVSLFFHHSFTPQGGPPVFPPTLSPGHHKCSLIEHFLLTWPFILFGILLSLTSESSYCFQTP